MEVNERPLFGESANSPCNIDSFSNMFDLSDLTNEVNEFQRFYKSSDFVEYNPTERPENPFHKNFFENLNHSKDLESKKLEFSTMKKTSSY